MVQLGIDVLTTVLARSQLIIERVNLACHPIKTPPNKNELEHRTSFTAGRPPALCVECVFLKMQTGKLITKLQ